MYAHLSVSLQQVQHKYLSLNLHHLHHNKNRDLQIRDMRDDTQGQYTTYYTVLV